MEEIKSISKENEMSHRGLDPRDYEYDGSESAEVYSSAPATEVSAVERSSRFRITSAVTTAVLAGAGLLGGAAFAMSQVPLNQAPASAPLVQTPAPTAADAGSAPAPTPSATPTESAATSGSGTASGKTIAVPPAAFEDKHGERDFHTSAPSRSSSSVSTPNPNPSASVAAPSFGGGGEGSDDGGTHHHKRGTNPSPGATAAPNFGNNEDD